MFIGLAVIVGWHAHLTRLVQVIPGAIPMQYNTALCMLAVAVSSWLLLTDRGHHVMPAVGGLFAVVMGALVLYEYATGTSVGIDTLFFYPWLQTLSADPGRMALTSALCFLCSGLALIILSIRPSAIATFAILHTLPVSLGLTSVVGYTAGITFVLPFYLGTQMAVHTAVAFLGQGTTMLAYAWRQTQARSKGEPRWITAVGIFMVPFFFLGTSFGAQRTSIVSIATLFLGGLLVAGLIAIAANKLTQTSIKRRGLILVSVPLVFLFVFVVFVRQLSRRSEQAEEWSLHSKDVITQTASISANLLDAEASIRGFVITGDAAFAQRYDDTRKRVPEEAVRLQALVHDNPEQEARARQIANDAESKLAFLADIEQLMRSGNRAQAIERIKSGEGLRMMNNLQLTQEAFLTEERRFEMERHIDLKSSWHRFNWLLGAGTAVDIFLGVILAILFSGGISRRLINLTENAKALAEGTPLSDPIRGSDEIAHLDHVFREMAGALQDAARKERAIFDNALDVVCAFDVEGRFVKVSPSCFKTWGYSAAELIGKPYTDLVVQEDEQRSHDTTQKILEGGAVTDFENRYRRKDGEIVVIQWSAWWSESEHVIYAIARNVTERKQAENAIHQLNENLEKQATQLAGANKELEAFSYSVSHDLRAPLRAIDGFSRILEEDHSDKLDDDALRLLTVIRHNTQKMGNLIDDLLAFSRLGRKPIERTPINMQELASDVSTQIFSAKSGELDLRSLQDAEGDPTMVRQVFFNLLSNAEKYSRTKDSPRIEVGGYSENGENVYYVKDNGAGFDMTYANKLFGVFQRLHSAEEFEGTGVGLAIVQRIIHRHGGRVWANGEVNNGATFYFTLPKEHSNGRHSEHE